MSGPYRFTRTTSSTQELDAGPVAKSYYTEADVAGRPAEIPGQFPYTRGIESKPGRPLIKFYAGLGSPEQSNRRFRELSRLGVEEIQIAADLPTQVGYDSDHLMAFGEVGRAGVAISSIEDMKKLFAGIPLSSLIRVGMLGNSIGPIALALFVVLGEEQGLATADYCIDLQNDPLKEYIARGTQFLPVQPALEAAVDVVQWCAEEAPHWYPLDACVNHINAAGAGSTRGTAFALANMITYCDALLRRGAEFDSFAPMLQMFLDEREDFFVGVANVRASRRVWAKIAKDRFGARDPLSMALQVTAYGHGRETRQEPLNNLVRIALGCLAYRVAGVQTMYSASYDEARSTPSDEAVALSVRTQQILGCEQGFDVTLDPLGGSYYVEALTDEIEEGIVAELAAVEAQGGSLVCIDNGYFRSVIADGAVRRQARFEDGRRLVVGINCFEDPAETTAAGPVQPGLPTVDQALEDSRRRDLEALRESRDQREVRQALADVEAAARQRLNTVPPTIRAVRARATVGEISDVLRAVHGEWDPDRRF
jgi:methylmalonyl-CoA mutase N-terminal domain/subunit